MAKTDIPPTTAPIFMIAMLNYLLQFQQSMTSLPEHKLLPNIMCSPNHVCLVYIRIYQTLRGVNGTLRTEVITWMCVPRHALIYWLWIFIYVSIKSNTRGLVNQHARLKINSEVVCQNGTHNFNSNFPIFVMTIIKTEFYKILHRIVIMCQ